MRSWNFQPKLKSPFYVSFQEREFELVGRTRSIRADFRVIAATNRDPKAAVGDGSFGSDLFYRLRVFPIEIPPLRERKEDIPLLVEYFIDRYAQTAGKNLRGVSKKTLELLESYRWPGNIRELQNVVERSLILCETGTFSIDGSWLSQQPSVAESRNQLELPRRLLAHERTSCSERKPEPRVRTHGSSSEVGHPRLHVGIED